MKQIIPIESIKKRSINKSINMAFRTKLRRWGNSYGILIPITEIQQRKLKEGQEIELQIREEHDCNRFFGQVKFKKPLQKIMQEIDEGYDEA